eukprot:266801-Chlamydomonas_euryale.AAC.2
MNRPVARCRRGLRALCRPRRVARVHHGPLPGRPHRRRERLYERAGKRRGQVTGGCFYYCCHG